MIYLFLADEDGCLNTMKYWNTCCAVFPYRRCQGIVVSWLQIFTLEVFLVKMLWLMSALKYLLMKVQKLLSLVTFVFEQRVRFVIYFFIFSVQGQSFLIKYLKKGSLSYRAFNQKYHQNFRAMLFQLAQILSLWDDDVRSLFN